MPWLFLGIAITGEVIGTTALKASHGFTRLGYGSLALLSYAISFYFLAIILKTIPIGVAYAIWSGAGVALVTFIGVVLLGQKLDFYAFVGIGLIVAGVMVLNLLSGTTTH